MNSLVKYIIAPLITVVIIGGVVYFFFKSLIFSSVPLYEGEVALKGLTGEVIISTGENNLPFIKAGNRKDLLFALGYLHARDRLLGLEFKRIICKGRLSQYFGKSNLGYDKYFRMLRFPQRAKLMIQELDPETTALINAYIAGINGFLTSESSVFPNEFAALNIKPEKWEPADVVMLSLLENYTEENKFLTDDIITMVKKKIGPAKSALVFGKESDSSFFTDLPEFDEEGLKEEIRLRKTLALQNSTGIDLSEVTGLQGIFLNLQAQFTFPGKFYQVVFEAEGRKGSVATLPGSPVPLAGLVGDEFSVIETVVKDIREVKEIRLDENNEIIADKKNPDKLVLVKDTIRIKGEEPEIIELRVATGGNVFLLQGGTETGYNRDSSETYEYKIAQSLKLSGFDPLNFLQVGCSLWLGNLENKHFSSEANADLWWIAGGGKLTKNAAKFIPRKDDNEEKITKKPGKKPKAQKKPKGKQSDKSEDEPPKSSERDENGGGDEPVLSIREVTSSGKNFFFNERLNSSERGYLSSPEGKDLPSFVVNDVTSNFSLSVVPYILNAFNGKGAKEKSTVVQSLKVISGWSGEYLSTLQAPLIVSVFLKYFTLNIFEGKLGKDDLELLLSAGGIPAGRIEQVLEDRYSPVFDFEKTAELEDRDEVIRISFRQAIEDLTEHYGNDPINWLWGLENRIAPAHAMRNFLGGLDKAIVIEPAGLSGSFDTRFAAFNNPFLPVGEKHTQRGTLLRFFIDPAKGVFRMVPYIGTSGNFADERAASTYQQFLEGKLITVQPQIKEGDKILKLIRLP
ncbi:MAG: penicillin acylase family protein [Ignavibacteriales bacterium]|nr:MAG: penicillin acylase family protein [Ignavibacteriaceae bacterium]MBW7872472.1 penicillin acylase family protein [Ignavibacteria bacterium]MCZ2141975.1 penicillin acylase family protein [Ignavibacteriales bacterium]OQY70347.1 MAG: hypothetical protein B6D45_11340 [Ignavibacteriales bacterium UTCHB3]MBV6445141.1 hypothetical protein [Ignavibacteriaceae bacterium]